MPAQAFRIPPSASSSDLPKVLEERFPREMARPLRVGKRTFLHHQGTEVAAVHYLLSGTVAKERLDEDGRMSMFGVMGPGSLIGWQELLDSGIHRNSAKTLSVCEVVVIARAAFLAVLRSDGRIVESLMRQGAAQLTAYEDHMIRLSTPDLAKRIYATLCSFARQQDVTQDVIEIALPMLKRDLAILLGTTPESLSRSLRKLEDLDVATFTGRNTVRLRLGWE